MAGVRNKPQKSGKYHAWYINYKGKRLYFTGTKSKSQTRKIAEKLESEHREIRLGFRPIPKPELKRRNLSFREVADDYLEWGKTQGGRNGRPWGKTHAKERKSKLEWWEKKLKLVTIDDLIGILPKAEKALRKLKKKGCKGKGLSGKTISNYVDTLHSFCNWALKRKYLSEDPLKDISPFDTTPTTKRRALTPEEIHRLLEAAPEYRRILYEVALTTGLRAGELRALTLGCIDAEKGIFILDPSWTKNRKGGEQPIPRTLVKKLVIFGLEGTAKQLYEKRYGRIDSKLGDIPDNPLLYVSTHPSRELRKDLKAAGIEFNIPGKGKVDFHALRVAFVTLSFEAGANMKECQTLARHSTPELTANIYARSRDDRLKDLADLIGNVVLSDDLRANSVQWRITS